MNTVRDRDSKRIGWIAHVKLHLEGIHKSTLGAYFVGHFMSRWISATIERVAIPVKRIKKPWKIIGRARLKIIIAVD